MGGRGASSATAGVIPFNEHNFFTGTAADFTSVERPDRDPDYVSDSGSEYWYSKDGVVRGANHWGTGIASTDWFLDGNDISSYDRSTGINGVKRYGKARWSDFVQNADYWYSYFGDTLPESLGKPVTMETTWDNKVYATFKVPASKMADNYALIGSMKVRFSELYPENRIYDREEMLARKREKR